MKAIKGIDPKKINLDENGKVIFDQVELDEVQLSGVSGGIEIIRGTKCTKSK